MALTDEQLCTAYDALIQGAVCLDEHLVQGVWVYVEGLMIERNIPRDEYLCLYHLQSPQCFMSMSSLMPIDFFGTNENPKNETPCRDANFKPIVLKTCELIQRENEYPEQCWCVHTTYCSDDVEIAIQTLLRLLADYGQFPRCIICKYRYPAGFLDSDSICEDCCYELLGC
ncbi:hypothetical protein L4C36_12190 [Photobacterium japonica]|uniref:hypothetical protein n=1 Tax=Photobacterium japonica TaxID=2910235 RepID=UPI003D0A1381